MRRLLIIMALSVIVASCDKDGDKGSGDWKPAAAPATDIYVTASGAAVEEFHFTYDDNGRVSTLKRVDMTNGATLLDLRYSYDGKAMAVKGLMNGKIGQHSITATRSGKELTCTSDAWNAIEYKTSIGNDGVARSTVASSKFTSNAEYYSSEMSYVEDYELAGGDIAQVTNTTEVNGKTEKAMFSFANAFKPAKLASEASLVTCYSYTGMADSQNFNALVFNCNLPVWYAQGLPGCRHLVSDINMNTNGTAMPQAQHFEYTLDSNGRLQTATRTFTSGGKAYLELEYRFSYGEEETVE